MAFSLNFTKCCFYFFFIFPMCSFYTLTSPGIRDTLPGIIFCAKRIIRPKRIIAAMHVSLAYTSLNFLIELELSPGVPKPNRCLLVLQEQLIFDCIIFNIKNFNTITIGIKVRVLRALWSPALMVVFLRENL